MFIGLSREFPGMEAISFQGASPLATELTKMFQGILDFKAKLVEAGDPDAVKKVLAYHKKIVPKRYATILKKTIGLELTEFIDTRGPTLGFAAGIGFGTSADSFMLTHKAMENITGIQNPDNPVVVDKGVAAVQKSLANIDALIDRETSTLKDTKSNIFGKLENLTVKIHFCPYSAYFSRETLDADIEPFTAAEIAAVQLHEIGHVMSLIEHASDLIRSINTITESVQVREFTLSEKAILEEKAEALASAATALKRFTANNRELDKVLGDVAESAANVSQLPKQSTLAGRFAGVIFALVQASAVAVVGGIYGAVAWTLGPIFAGGKEFSEVLEGFRTKTSDFMTHYGERSLCERYADEFVSRHGFASQLALGMNKVMSLTPSLGKLGFAGSRESVIVSHITTFQYYMLAFMTASDYTTGGTYDHIVKRTNDLLRDVTKAFKVVNVPQELQEFYLSNYEDMQKVVRSIAKEQKLRDKAVSTAIYVHNTISLPRLMKLILTGNADKHYRKLMDALQDINSSSLYYHATRLQHMTRQK